MFQQLGADALAARRNDAPASFYFSAMLLVGRRVEPELRRADDFAVDAGGEQDDVAARNALNDFLVERRRVLARERVHEIDRSAAGNAIFQHCGKRVEIGRRRIGAQNGDLDLAHAARSSFDFTVASASSR